MRILALGACALLAACGSDAGMDAPPDAGAPDAPPAPDASDPITLRGTIRLVGDAPPGGVTVRFEPGGASTVTDDTGAFALAAPPGAGSLSFDRDGYHEDLPSVIASADGGGIARDGGAVAPIVDLEVPHARRFAAAADIDNARWLPDGQRVLFHGPGAEPGLGTILIGPPGGDVVDLQVRVNPDDLRLP